MNNFIPVSDATFKECQQWLDEWLIPLAPDFSASLDFVGFATMALREGRAVWVRETTPGQWDIFISKRPFSARVFNG